MTGHRASATQVPLSCSGLINHSAYLRRTSAREGGVSTLRSEHDPKTKILTYPQLGSRYG
jgi:hypothetical protein